MRKVCVIMGGVMPVPAVCGGAIETLITSIAKRYSKDDGFALTVFSVYHKDAVEAAKRFPDVKFVWTHTNTFWNLSKHAVFLGVRELTGKTIRVLQRHYNEIAPYIQHEKFDLLLVEGGDEQAVIDIAKGYRREQLVFHAHIHFIPKDEVVKGYGHMIGVSEFVVREYLKACKLPVKAHTLKNAIDTGKFQKSVSEESRKKLRKELGLQEDDFIVLYVGRMIPVKGVLELMQAILAIGDPQIKLLCVGSANFGKWAFSTYEKTVRKLADEHKDQILFTGYVDNSVVYQYADLADVQCVPSLWEEASGLVVLEAMSEGLPLIVTQSGGMVEYIDNTTALVIQRENIVDNLKEAIRYMKAHPEVRQQMSQAGKQHSQQYDETVYYQSFVHLIKQIMDDNHNNAKSR